MKIEPKQVIENRYEIIEKLGEGGMETVSLLSIKIVCYRGSMLPCMI